MDSHALQVLEFDRIRDLVAAHCRSELGRGVVAELVPETHFDRVELSRDQLVEASALESEGAGLPLDGLADLRGLVEGARAANRPLEPVELLKIAKSLRIAKGLVVFCDQRRARAPRLAELSDRFLKQAQTVDEIEAVVESPGVVADRASSKLWDLRRAVERVEDEARTSLSAYIDKREVRPALQHHNVTIRNGRFVLAVKEAMRGRVPGILHGHSQTGATVFIEPSHVVELATQVKDLQFEIGREESRILWEITRALFAKRHDLGHTASLLAWFDFTAARARFGKNYQFVAPELAKDGVLRLLVARHPLLLTTMESAQVVPIDARLREGFSVLVITGPNTGGKTVTLKTIGLIQAMFQSGLPVPVGEGSRLPVFRGIYADIGDEQSLDQSLSTFSGHIANIAAILALANNKTLVLLDELGAGTDPVEGAALGEAILDSLREKGSAAVVTTHLGSLKDFAFARPDVENASVEFDPETMRPTFRLLIGQPGNSNALAVASRFGIDADVVERARAVLAEGEARHRDLIDQLLESRRDLELQRDRSDKTLVRSKNLAKSNEEKARHLEKRERRLQREAEATVEDALGQLLNRAEGHLRALSNVPKSLLADYESLQSILRQSRQQTSLAGRRREWIKTLKKGDDVVVPRFEKTCRIRKFNRGEEKVTVMVGNLAMEVGYDDISWLGPEPQINLD